MDFAISAIQDKSSALPLIRAICLHQGDLHFLPHFSIAFFLLQSKTISEYVILLNKELQTLNPTFKGTNVRNATLNTQNILTKQNSVLFFHSILKAVDLLHKSEPVHAHLSQSFPSLASITLWSLQTRMGGSCS